MFDTDPEIFQFATEKLYVAAVCDILDSLGFRNQAMSHRLRPLLRDPRTCGFVGRARTIRWMDIDYVDSEDPYGLEIEAMDSLGPGDVVIHSSDPALRNAPWGELMTTVAKRNGAVGCVCDSNIRDCVRIMEMEFPVFCTGIRPLDSQGRGLVKAYDVPVECGGVLVHPRELVFADFDGVVVVPQSVERKVLELAYEKTGKENGLRRMLNEGKSLREAYNVFGVL